MSLATSLMLSFGGTTNEQQRKRQKDNEGTAGRTTGEHAHTTRNTVTGQRKTRQKDNKENVEGTTGKTSKGQRGNGQEGNGETHTGQRGALPKDNEEHCERTAGETPNGQRSDQWCSALHISFVPWGGKCCPPGGPFSARGLCRMTVVLARCNHIAACDHPALQSVFHVCLSIVQREASF